MLCACVVGVVFLCVIGTCSLGFPGISVAGCVCCLLLCWVLFGVLWVWVVGFGFIAFGCFVLVWFCYTLVVFSGCVVDCVIGYVASLRV